MKDIFLPMSLTLVYAYLQIMFKVMFNNDIFKYMLASDVFTKEYDVRSGPHIMVLSTSKDKSAAPSDCML